MIAKSLVAAICLWGVSVTLTPDLTRGACLPTSEMESFLLEKTRGALRHPNLRGSFESSGLTAEDQMKIQVVRVDSICRAAVLTVNRDLRVPDTTSRSLHLFSVGKTYRAIDPSSELGEFMMGWVLDSSLTKVEGRLAM